MSAPRAETPNGMPDLRLWLRDNWRPRAPFWRVAHLQHMALRGTDHNPEVYARWEASALERATLWWVSEDMVDLLLASAPSVPDDMLGSELTPPAPAGLIVFAKPWFGIDSTGSGNAVQVDAFVWDGARLPATTVPGEAHERLAWGLSTYTRVDFVPGEQETTRAPIPDDAPRTENVRGLGGLDGNNVMLPGAIQTDMEAGGVERIEEWGATWVQRTPDRIAPLGSIWTPLGRSDWPHRHTLTRPIIDGMDQATVASAVEDRRVFAAFCSLIAQEGITRTERHPPQRQAVKRQVRAGIPEATARDLRIITLRPVHRTDSQPGDETEAHNWSHRWIVNGHWRWQPYGPGRSERRLTWIRPYVKGPDDKPLRIKEEVRAWVR